MCVTFLLLLILRLSCMMPNLRASAVGGRGVGKISVGLVGWMLKLPVFMTSGWNDKETQERSGHSLSVYHRKGKKSRKWRICNPEYSRTSFVVYINTQLFCVVRISFIQSINHFFKQSIISSSNQSFLQAINHFFKQSIIQPINQASNWFKRSNHYELSSTARDLQ